MLVRLKTIQYVTTLGKMEMYYPIGTFWDDKLGCEVDYVGLWVCGRCYRLLDWECDATPNFLKTRCCICDELAYRSVITSLEMKERVGL